MYTLNPSAYIIANSVEASNRAQILDLEEYGHWKLKMEDYLTRIEPDLQRSITQ